MEQANRLIYFLLMLCVGYGAGRTGLLDERSSKGIAPLLMNLCYPAMIITTFAGTDPAQIFGSGMQVVVATLAINGALIALSSFFLRSKPPVQRALMRFMLNIGNITYVGIPLLSIFLPESAISLVVLHGSVQDFLIWLYFYPSFLAGSEKSGICQLLRSPCLISLGVGLVLMLLPIPLPTAVSMTLEGLAGMTTPLASIYLGALVSRYGIRAPFRSRAAIRYSLIKVILIPTAVFVCSRLLLGFDNAMLLALLYGCPAPLMSVIWAQQHDADVEQTGSSCICSTLLFIPIASCVLYICSSIPGV